MDVKAISGLNFNSLNSMTFEGKNKKNKKTNMDYPQHDAPVSKKGSHAIRNTALALAALSAAPIVTSCDKYDDDVYASASSSASASASASANGNGGNGGKDTVIVTKPDTIFEHDTIYQPVKYIPKHLSDSLVAQGINIGAIIEGPKPDGSGKDDVVFFSSKAHNRYDNKYYESELAERGNTEDQLVINSTITDKYYTDSPKTTYMKTLVTDVSGKGIRLERWISNSSAPNAVHHYAGYEIRSNGYDGKANKVYVYDKNDELVYKAQYERGEEDGTFMYSTLVYDDEGNIYYDEDGNPEVAKYDFDEAKIKTTHLDTKDYIYSGWKYDE